jgi:hypothetical protein
MTYNLSCRRHSVFIAKWVEACLICISGLSFLSLSRSSPLIAAGALRLTDADVSYFDNCIRLDRCYQ